MSEYFSGGFAFRFCYVGLDIVGDAEFFFGEGNGFFLKDLPGVGVDGVEEEKLAVFVSGQGAGLLDEVEFPLGEAEFAFMLHDAEDMFFGPVGERAGGKIVIKAAGFGSNGIR